MTDLSATTRASRGSSADAREFVFERSGTTTTGQLLFAQCQQTILRLAIDPRTDHHPCVQPPDQDAVVGVPVRACARARAGAARSGVNVAIACSSSGAAWSASSRSACQAARSVWVTACQ